MVVWDRYPCGHFGKQVRLPIAPDFLTDLRTTGIKLLTVTGGLLHDDSHVLRVQT